MKGALKNTCLLLCLLPSVSWAKDAPAPKRVIGEISSAENACDGSEGWTYSASVPEEAQNEFGKMLTDPSAIYNGFQGAIHFMYSNHALELATLGEYWVSRSLLNAKLVPLAHRGFNAIVSKPSHPKIIGIQLAAMECLNILHRNHPSLGLSAQAIQNLLIFPTQLVPAGKKKIIAEAGINVLKTWMSQAARSKAAEAQLTVLFPRLLNIWKGSGAFERLGRGLYNERIEKYQDAVRDLKAFVDDQPLPHALEPQLDLAYLVMARSHYLLKQYDRAADAYRKVPKSSNHLTQALTELSWAYLLENRHREAIGTSVDLVRSILGKTFSPEAPMIASIALNELCQFPLAIQTVQIFRKRYGRTYQWLYDWYTKRNQDSGSLYKLAVNFLQDPEQNKFNPPRMIANEWLRSPIFIASQEEINLLLDTQSGLSKLIRGFLKDSESKQEELIVSIRKKARELSQQAAGYRGKSRTKRVSGSSATEWEVGMDELRRDLTTLRNRRIGSQLWRNLLADLQKRIPASSQALISKINEDLARRNNRMIQRIVRVAQNTQFVEVEIFNGAGEDMIWRNAHPDYKDIVGKIKDQDKFKDSMVWKWGASSIDDEGKEQWEDEFAWAAAELRDECSNKNKYLMIKTQ